MNMPLYPVIPAQPICERRIERVFVPDTEEQVRMEMLEDGEETIKVWAKCPPPPAPPVILATLPASEPTTPTPAPNSSSSSPDIAAANPPHVQPTILRPGLPRAPSSMSNHKVPSYVSKVRSPRDIEQSRKVIREMRREQGEKDGWPGCWVESEVEVVLIPERKRLFLFAAP